MTGDVLAGERVETDKPRRHLEKEENNDFPNYMYNLYMYKIFVFSRIYTLATNL